MKEKLHLNVQELIKVAESAYSGFIESRKEHDLSPYNQSISMPPSRHVYIDGENLNIVGFIFKSIENYQPHFQQVGYNLNNHRGKYNILDGLGEKCDSGYSLIDYVRLNNQNHNNIRGEYSNVVNNHDLYQKFFGNVRYRAKY